MMLSACGSKTGNVAETAETVDSLTTDSAGGLWICSYGKGLTYVDASGKVSSFDSGENNLGTRVRVCRELSDGTMAVGGDAGLSFVKNGAWKL